MSNRPNRDLSGMEPTLGHNTRATLTGDEPILGGDRRLDPRILEELSAGRWVPVERLKRDQSGLSPTERARYARALVDRLKAIAPWQFPPTSRNPRGPILLVLGVLGDPIALPSLIAALSDREFAVRRAAIQGLGHLGDPGGIVPLLDLLDTSLRDRISTHPFLVVDALGRIGATDPDRVVPRLLDLLEHDVWADLKLHALTALGRISDPRAVEPLIRVLHTHGDFRHRREAARALARIDHENVLPALILALTDRYRDVRYAVATALGYLDDSRAVQHLQMAYLNERVIRVRHGIERALAHLGARPPGPDNPVPLPWFGTFWHPDTPLET
jgi:HEAT repeat protein